MRRVPGSVLRDLSAGVCVRAFRIRVSPRTEKGSTISLEENKAIVRRTIEAADRLSMEGLDEIAVPEILGQWEKSLAWTQKIFLGHRIQITDMVAEGDKVWVRLTTSGGYAGGWMAIAATEKQWRNTRVGFYRLAGGKIVEYEGLFTVWGICNNWGPRSCRQSQGENRICTFLRSTLGDSAPADRPFLL